MRLGGSLGGPGWALVERALATVERHHMLAAGDLVVVAASGGADSTCLLDVLARISGRLDLSLAVAHLDHGLSEHSGVVAARLARDAAAAGFDVHVARAAPELAGSNLQARARAFRYEFLTSLARELGAGRVATGHTLDDRVETTVARLVHGAGTEGLAGIPPTDGVRIRPLIDLRRAETRRYCAERALEFFDDPANEDDRFERVAVRRRVVAAIEEEWGAGAIRAMAASAQRLREDAEALRVLAERVYSGLVTSSEDGVALDLDAVVALPVALRRRVLERAVGRVRDRSGGIEAALDALGRNRERTRRFAVASGVEITVSSDRVTVTRPSKPVTGDN